MTRVKRVPYRYNWAHLIPVLIVFVVIMVQIWHSNPQNPTPLFYIVILVLMGSVNYFCKDRLGIWPKNLEQIFAFAVLVVCFWAVLFFSSGAGSGGFKQSWLKVGGWISWALAQQYILNGFFVNRLAAFYKDEKDGRVPLFAALLFCVAHTPNRFLMVVTFFGGYCCVKNFLRERNLYLLAFFHMIISFLILSFVPESITHGFRIGPDYHSP